MKPTCAARQRARFPSDNPSMRWPAMSISPASVWSMPPSKLSKVVLPDPEGPITAKKSARGIVRWRRSKIVIVSLPLVKRLLTPARRIKELSGANFSVSCRGTPRASVRGGGFLRRDGGRAAVLEERDLHGHVGKDARVLLAESDAHPHRRLLAIGRRHDGDHVGRDGPVRIGVELRVHGAAPGDAADECLVDVDLDLVRIHVDARAHAGASATP